MSTLERYHGTVRAPWGALGYAVSDGALSNIDFLFDPSPAPPARDMLGRHIEYQLRRFLDSPRATFDLPLRLVGTPFQQRVWNALRRIAPGERRSYGELARQLRSGARAVAGACRANSIPIVIPCHRVVAASGLGGFCGASAGRVLQIKSWLLAHEGGGAV